MCNYHNNIQFNKPSKIVQRHFVREKHNWLDTQQKRCRFGTTSNQHTCFNVDCVWRMNEKLISFYIAVDNEDKESKRKFS